MDRVKVVVPPPLVFTATILQRVGWAVAAEVCPKVVSKEFLGEAILKKFGEFDR